MPCHATERSIHLLPLRLCHSATEPTPLCPKVAQAPASGRGQPARQAYRRTKLLVALQSARYNPFNNDKTLSPPPKQPPLHTHAINTPLGPLTDPASRIRNQRRRPRL
ncbi:hypothetical protein BX600DRAFT_187105 [Xylariales sp. PMI_506]|nr:hypothetical protein BX600DRAFT_187105 [Xylariales sp. PMI_506]